MSAKEKENVNAVINSKRRLNPLTETASNFTFSFNEKIVRIDEIVIKSIQIPFTFYATNATNNVLTFNNNANSITVPPGNYSAATLATLLKNLIDAEFGDISNVTFSNETFKVTIAKGIAFKVDSITDSPASTMAKSLGFLVSSATSTNVVSDSAVNLSGSNYINVSSNFLTKAVNHKFIYRDNSYENVLVSLPVLGGFGDVLDIGTQWVIPITFSYKLTINPTDIIDIFITDDDGNILDLNGSDVSMQLSFITR